MNLRTRVVATRVVAGAAAGAMGSLLGVAATPANADPSRAHLATATTAAVTGTLKGHAFKGHAFKGQMSHLSASVVNGTVTLSGSLTGPGFPAAGTKFTTEINSVTPVTPGPCRAGPCRPGPCRAGPCRPRSGARSGGRSRRAGLHDLGPRCRGLTSQLAWVGHPRPRTPPHRRWGHRAERVARQRAVQPRGRS
jgi:hypothetical protein